MTPNSDQQLVDLWRGESAPLLPLLHAFHERDGYLSEDALRAVSVGLKTPLADLYGTVTFYHHFGRTPGSRQQPRVCTGPVCCMNGAKDVLAALESEGATAMPCAGRCDDPIPVLRGNQTFVGSAGRALESRMAPLPPPPPDAIDECVFAGIRAPNRSSLAGYKASGGYVGLEKAREAAPLDVIDILDASGLTGRGGAGFPTGAKWRAVANEDRGPKSIVCNADEGEPGCFKDRAIMDYDPHAVIEGMAIAAHATGATRGYIYLRYEYPETFVILETAIKEATSAGLIGGDFSLVIRRGAGAYICGEEGSLLNSMEGKHPFPRNRPPFPVSHGFEDLPTAVNNVETLASIPNILANGAEWYAGLGRGDHKGTKVISLSGDVQRPGNYEVPLGFPLKTLIHEWAGGPSEGRTVRAVTMAGLSGGFLAGDSLDITLDDPTIKQHGSFLGAGGIMVFDDSRNMVEMAHDAMEFFADESCGKCFPCRIGTQRLTERLAGTAGPTDVTAWIDEVNDIGAAMKSTSACGLGIAAPLVTDSLLKYFPDQVAAHVAGQSVDQVKR